MAITLDGTNGITAPEIISTAGPVVIDASAANNSLVVVANGNVGIGTTSPVSPLHVYLTDATTYGDGTGALDTTNLIRVQNDSEVNDTYSGIQLVSENAAGTAGWWSIASVSTASNYDNDLVFHTRTGASTYAERMRIDSAGNLMVGTTSPGNSRLSISNTSANTVNMSIVNTNRTDQSLTLNVMGETGFGVTGWSDSAVIEAAQTGNATGTKALYLSAYSGPMIFATNARNERMRIDSAGAVTIANLAGAGSRTVTANSGGGLSAASDSRLKHEVPDAPIPGLAEIMQLEPRAYQWLDDIENRGEDAAVEIGFFADQVKDIIPSAAPMGNDGYYGFYDRAVIAALTKAVQEQQVLITALTDRIEVLETTQ